MGYYTSQEHFERLFENTARTYTVQAEDKDAFLKWKDEFRRELVSLLGMDKMKKCPPRAEILEEVPCRGYTRRKICIHTEEDIVMPFYMLIPDGLQKGEKRTVLIACHGHSSCGKEAVAGVREKGCISDTIDHYHYNYGEIFAQKGYIVFAPDARGFGERRERYDQGEEAEKMLTSSCGYLNAMALSLGQTVLGMWLWDLQRLADYALSCPCVNGHVCCVGLSGGGMQSLWLAALDERMECSVVSGYFYGYLQSLLINYNCWCNYVPGLWERADISDIASLICPRPLLIETGSQDSLNGKDGLGNVLPQVEKVRQSMRLFGKEENLVHDIFDGEHRWNGDKAYGFVEKHAPAKMEDMI